MNWFNPWISAFEGGAGGSFSAPTVTNIEPTPDTEPGEAGAFSIDFRVARLTPIEFDLTNIPAGARIGISIKWANRNETYLALDFDSSATEGDFVWPFDVQPSNSIGPLASEPVHVTLLPRGGWPPGVVTIKTAAVQIGTVP